LLYSSWARKAFAHPTGLAVVGIVVDAKDSTANSFYRHFGFMPLPGQSNRLLLPATAFCTLA